MDLEKYATDERCEKCGKWFESVCPQDIYCYECCIKLGAVEFNNGGK